MSKARTWLKRVALGLTLLLPLALVFALHSDLRAQLAALGRRITQLEAHHAEHRRQHAARPAVAPDPAPVPRAAPAPSASVAPSLPRGAWPEGHHARRVAFCRERCGVRRGCGNRCAAAYNACGIRYRPVAGEPRFQRCLDRIGEDDGLR